jgi:DNA polymerase-1
MAARNLIVSLGLPAPLVTASGGKGYHLLVPYASPVSAAKAREFMGLVRSAACAGLPDEKVELRPDTDADDKSAAGNLRPMPALHQRAGTWGCILDVQEGAYQPSAYAGPPDFAQQAALMAAAGQATEEQLDRAIAHLTALGHVSRVRRHTEELPEPILARLGPEQHPPCIRALLKHGAPRDDHYSRANVNLAAYCRSRRFGVTAATALATEMAEASSDHGTSKRSVQEKVANFSSNKNTQPFRCYARAIGPHREILNAEGGCDACPANPDGRSSFPGAGKAAGASGAHGAGEEAKSALRAISDAVAMDLLAYSWARNIPVPPNLIRVMSGLAERAAGTVCGVSTTRAALGEEALRLAEAEMPKKARQIDFGPVEFANVKVDAFLSRLDARIAAFREDPELEQRSFDAAIKLVGTISQRNHLIELVNEAVAMPPSTPATVVAAQLVKAASAVMTENSGAGVLANRADGLMELFAKEQPPHVPLPRFPQLANLLHGGLHAGRLIIAIAPPKSGKTTLASNLMLDAAQCGNPVLYVGFEMAIDQMVTAMVARKAQIDSRYIEQRKLSRAERRRVDRALKELLSNEGQLLELWEAAVTTTISDAAAWAIRAKQAHPDKVPFIVVDYLQLARLGMREVDANPSETARVSHIAVAAKDLARMTGAAVLALSSVTKSAESSSTQSGEIDVNAARDSLAIVHAGDTVISLQTANYTVAKKSDKKDKNNGDEAEQQVIGPWEHIAETARRRGDPLAVNYARAFEVAARQYPATKNRECHARIDVLRNRGATGSVCILYNKPFHEMSEVNVYGHIDGGNDYGPVDDIGDDVEEFDVVETPAPPTAPEPDAAPTHDAPAAPAPKAGYVYITSFAGVEKQLEWMLSTTDRVGFDIETAANPGEDPETAGLDPRASRIRLASITHAQHGTYLVDLDTIEGGVKALVPYLTAGAKLVAHNASFETKFLMHHAGLRDLVIDCTKIAAHVAGAHPHKTSLKAVASHFLGLEVDKAEQKSDWGGPLTPSQLQYATNDSAILLPLWDKVWKEVEERESQRVYTLVRDAQPAVAAIELAGMGFDVIEHQALHKRLEVERDELLGKLTVAMGVKKPTGNELQAYLTTQLGGAVSEAYYAWPKSDSGKLQTGEDAIKAHLNLLSADAHSVMLDLYLPFKIIEKRCTAFGANLAAHVSLKTARIHPSFNLVATITGRMACSQPNLQQIPKDEAYRGLFRPTALGRVLVIGDFNACELRAAAELAGETILIEAFREGRDPHRMTAARLLGKSVDEITKAERQLAKAVSFGLLFGQGAKGLAAYAKASYGVSMTEKDAGKHREAWLRGYPAIRAWQSRTDHSAKRTLQVSTPAGRLRRWEHHRKDEPGSYKLTEALNLPIQGGAAEAMLAAMAHLHRSLLESGIDAQMVATVHDELIIETAERDADRAKELLEAAMVAGFVDIFPGSPVSGLVEAHIAKSWAEK